MGKSEEIISNDTLFNKFVTPPMEKYFYTKLKNDDPGYVRLKLCELLKFLIISHNSFGNIPFNDEIDEIWHLWILQTIQYQELMDKLPEKKFIHHSSNDYKNSEGDFDFEQDINTEFSYLVSYVKNFGGFTKETSKFWPMVIKLQNIMKTNLEDLNKYLQKVYLEQSNF